MIRAATRGAARAMALAVLASWSAFSFAQAGPKAADAAAGQGAAARAAPGFSLQAEVGALVPILDIAASLNTGFSLGLRLDCEVLPFASPFFRIDYASLPMSGAADSGTILYPLSIVDAHLGLSFDFGLGERFTAGLNAGGGPSLYSWPSKGAAIALSWSAAAYLGFRISPEFEIDVTGSYNAGGGLFPGVGAGLFARYNLGRGGASASRLTATVKALSPVFPVFMSYYDANPLGSVTLENGEGHAVHDVKVSLMTGQFMSQPKLCAAIDSLAAGDRVDLPLYALFGDDILSVTANTTLPATVVVEYRILGSLRRLELPLELSLFHRNAMNWLDDRRAAAFVSPTDPAVLWFSRSTASVLGERMRNGISKNLQIAMGLFEAERLFGMNYVVDPSSSYVENAGDESSVDYLQYPSQTLFFRGGDCDDLSILYCSLLQSLGIETAFITIPGHIYMAFRLDLDADEAAAAFSDPALVIMRGAEAWIPVEITMVKDGFVKAWRIGAKEWADNAKTGSANFYPMREAWKLYPSVGIPGVTARFSLPSDADTMQAFDTALDRYVVKAIDAEVRTIALDPSRPQTPAVENALGIVYGRNGMLKDAWKHFMLSARAGEQAAWTNLANVAYLRRDFALAKQYYSWALKLDPTDDYALLGTARSSYELERFDDAGTAYDILCKRNPDLAGRYSYLASMFSGEGRAWSLADRMATTPWADPASRRQLIALAPVADPAPAPSSAAPAPVETAQTESDIQAATPSESISQAALTAASPAAEIPPSAPVAEEVAVAVAPDAAPLVVEEAPAIPARGEPPAAAEDATAAAARLVASIDAPELPPDLGIQAPVDRDLEAANLAAKRETEARAAETQTSAMAAVAQSLPEEASVPPAALAADESPTTAPASVAAELAPTPIENVAAAPAASDIALAALPETSPALSSDAAAVPIASLPQTEPAATPAVIAPAAVQPTWESKPIETTVSEALAPVPAPSAVGLAPAATASDSAWSSLALGFGGFRPAVGTWKSDRVLATHLRDDEYFAKMILPVAQPDGAYRFLLEARSTGSQWVGFGLHFAARPIATHQGYGDGHSWLVWLTSDPVHLGSAQARLQLYRSDLDTSLVKVADVPIPESLFDTNDIEIVVLPGEGSVIVNVNGIERLRKTGLDGLAGGDYVVLRALDKTEFTAFEAQTK